jgi:membrane protease YdiL (CAAX protease family)
MIRPFGRGQRDDSGGDEEEVGVELSLHHIIPLTAGGDADLGLPPRELPPLNASRLIRPRSPSVSPLQTPSLPHPDALKLLPVPGPTLDDGVEIRVRRPAPTPLPTPAPPAPDMAIQAEDAALTQQFDPLFGLVLYLAVAIGTATVSLAAETRYTILWTVLLGMGAVLALIDASARRQPTSTNVTWGLGIGVMIGLPLVVLTGAGLRATAVALFPDASLPALFQALVIVGPLGETLFFRGALQDRRGFAIAVIGAGLHNLFFFGPVALQSPVYLVVAGVFYTVLAAVYSYVRVRYGRAAAFVCQATANFMLIFVPLVIASFSGGPPA